MLNPIALKIEISLDLSLINIINPEAILIPAITRINDKTNNITFFSTFKASANVALV